MISFRNLLASDTRSEPDETAGEAGKLRLALALRGWVDPTRLLPQNLPDREQVKVLDAVAPDIQIALREQPGQWFLRDQERQRLLTTAPPQDLERAIGPRDETDAQDPVRTALQLRRRPVPANLEIYETEVLKALASTFTWLDQGLHWQPETLDFWDVGGSSDDVKQRVAATLARRRRREDVERMTSRQLRGRDSQLDQLTEWAIAPRETESRGRFLYVSGIGGAGKSTLFAHLEKRLWNRREHPLLVHIDCDMPGFDPTDPVALDLALFRQLATALPDQASQLIARANELSRATRETDAAYLAGTGRSRKRGRRIKAEADQSVHSFVGQEAAVGQKAGERSSVSDSALSQLGTRPLVLLFDTAELMLARAAVETSSEIAGTVEWFESLTGLMDGHDVRILMAGRNPPSDMEVEALTRRVEQIGWQAEPAMILGDLGEKDAELLLVDLGVDDPTLASRGAKVLPRTPLILKIAADVYLAGGKERSELAARLDASSIDPQVARRYLTERIVNHLASPTARPYALAAMVLARMTEPLLFAAVLPVVGDADVTRLLSREVMRGLCDAGWLVREEPDGNGITFHPEVRRLVLDLMESAPDLAEQLIKVRRLARDYHKKRRQAGDATFSTYYDLLLGADISQKAALDPNLLGTAFQDLSPAVQKQFTVAAHAAPATAAPLSNSLSGWTEYVEGSGKRDGEGNRLVKRGHAEAALELYRSRPTREPGVPPTFVLQALADAGYFSSNDIDVEAIVAELSDQIERASSESLPNALRSRIYWLTRYTLMAQPGPLSPMHHKMLAEAAQRTSGSGPVLLFPSIASVAEAFAPRRGPIAPDKWFATRGTIESETRMFLVHYLQFQRSFSWRPHLDALLVLQPDWPNLASWGFARDAGAIFEQSMANLEASVFPPGQEPGTQVDLNRFLRQLRTPVRIELPRKASKADAVRLLRGLTTEFHRPLRAAAVRYASGSDNARRELIDFTSNFLTELPLRTQELQSFEWCRRADRDLGAAFGLAIPFIDRARRLPSFCEHLSRFAQRTKHARDLAKIAAHFLKWDKALSAGLNSDWR